MIRRKSDSLSVYSGCRLDSVVVNGTPLGEATVTGYWGGAYEVVTGVTNDRGEISFKTGWVEQVGAFTFTVTSAEQYAVSYSLAEEVSDTIVWSMYEEEYGKVDYRDF